MDAAFSTYEIHVGETSYQADAQPFAQIMRRTNDSQRSVADGCVSADSRVFGTYLHGVFDGDGFRHAFIDAARAFCHLMPAGELNDWASKRENSFDRLASAVSESLDIEKIFAWVGLSHKRTAVAAIAKETR